MAKVLDSSRAKSHPAQKRFASKGQRVGYVRVSALDQNEIRQLEGRELDKVFRERASGKDTNRPQLEALLGFIREGDTLYCHSMDRLARNLDDLRKLVLGLTQRGVQVCFVKESLTFTGEDSPMSKLLLSVMGAFAQFERELLRERQREGIAIAKQAGKYRGRKPVLTAARGAELGRRAAAGESKAGLAREFRISRDTLYRYLAVAHQESKRRGSRHSGKPL
jgi:DNA invertase Pin-like site-specific DNA recombinase